MKSKVDIGIIAAMKIELDGIKQFMTDTETTVISGIEFTEGILYGKKIVAAVCGIGKVFAAICAQTMILSYKPEVIINTGVAGTLTDRLSIGDVAVASDVVQHDMDTTAIGDELGLISGLNIIHIPTDKRISELLLKCVREQNINVVFGTVASGDIFLNDDLKKQKISECFGAVACEMEGASIGQTCYVNGVPFAVLRSISDGGDDNSHIDYPVFVKLAAEKSITVLKIFIEQYR